MMKKTIAAGTIALMLAGAGAALAQSTPPREGMRMRPSAEDVAAFTDARIAALKAGLKLTAEQEKHWPAVETALRDLAKQRADRAQARADRHEARRGQERGQDSAAQAEPDAIARMREGADGLTQRAANLKKLADASEPLYKSLDDAQKRRFGALIRTGGRSMMGHHRMMHRGGDHGR
jgi:zinc resistance-associated protein